MLVEYIIEKVCFCWDLITKKNQKTCFYFHGMSLFYVRPLTWMLACLCHLFYNGVSGVSEGTT